MNTRVIDMPLLAGRYPDQALRGQLEQATLTLSLHGNTLLQTRLAAGSDSATLRCALPGDTAHDTLLALCEAVFSLHPGVHALLIDSPPGSDIDHLLAEGVLRQTASGLLCNREAFWQNTRPWLGKSTDSAYPLTYVRTGPLRHPLRPPLPSGVLYRRYIPWLGQTLTFERADPDRDLETFSRWMNAPRVAQFWEEQGSLEQHHAYLQKQLQDPHSAPLIGRFDGQAFGYFEIYWAREDRLAPFYDVQDHDRGLHLLVGEEAFRGQRYYTAWCSSICHYLFLDDPRTQRIVCEPRHDNLRQIANFDRSGFAKVKHFDFPHKRALLVMLSRERFFSDRLYQPLDAVHITD